MKTITIIGGGWLGRPLAHYLETIGHKVFVSKTSSDGVKTLEEEHLRAFQLNLDDDIAAIKTSLASHHPDIVIGCFPPGFRRGKGDEYAHQWKKLVEACRETKVTKIVMVSSTTVYPNIAKDMLERDATLALASSNDTFSDNAKIMLQAEQYVIDSGINYGIVRCSGLIGADRHPSRFASKLKQVSDLAPANMLHLTDAIGTVSYIAMHNNNVVVNATTPNTVNKAEFYQSALTSIGSEEPLPPLVHIADKRIVSDALVELGYKFHHQHTLELI
ncbi:NAD-dependent epimerase/dehydratase family protein [Vibrio japonicus]|uniref:NAD-dependent epimerase/dehydratase family protein n=1 Tax=Vibrio japonicus TaxID=1824638 RepID=A0ABY5LCY9_9VIBR|nr:NAD-dependent epimerase/dehydratase family protein [Vibrio japonicus]UUM29716.1 NAD-dependent epimerase/dehydratase family protein [Vibrio japonicus]